MAGESIAALYISLEVDDKASAGLAKIDGALGETSAEFEEAKAHASGFGDTVEKTGAGSVSFSSKIGNAATSLATVGASADRAMSLMDRYEISQMSVETATNNLERAQNNYNKVLLDNPADSEAVRNAAISLENAQNNLEKTNIRADSSMVMISISALSMVPQFIAAGTSALTFAASGTVIATMGATVTTAMGAMAAGTTFALSSMATAFTALSTFLLTNPIGIALLLIVGAVVALKLAWDSNFGGIQEKTATAVAWIKSHLDIILLVLGPIGWAIAALRKIWDSDWGGIQETLGSAVTFLKEKLGWLGDAISWVGEKLGGLLPATASAAEGTTALSGVTAAGTTAMSAYGTATEASTVSIMASTSAAGKLADAEYAAQQKVAALTKAHSEGKATMDQVIAAKAELKTATEAITESEKKQKEATEASTVSIEAMRSATISAAQARYDAWHAAQEESSGSSSSSGSDPYSGPVSSWPNTYLIPGATDTYITPSASARVSHGGISTTSGTSKEGNTIFPGEGLYDEADAFLKAKGFASGGAFWTSGPTPIMVGEGGESEYVSIIPKSKMGAGGAGINLTINTGNVYGVDDLDKLIDSAIRRVQWNLKALGG